MTKTKLDRCTEMKDGKECGGRITFVALDPSSPYYLCVTCGADHTWEYEIEKAEALRDGIRDHGAAQ